MKRNITMTIVTVATVAAAAAVWFWALRPLGFASYLSSAGATNADIIRQYWPHRLVEPEWISAKPDGFDRLMKWHIYETVARPSAREPLLSIWGARPSRSLHSASRRIARTREQANPGQEVEQEQTERTETRFPASVTSVCSC
jgi:hypothetical protein